MNNAKQTFNHKGTEISLNNKGEFTATCNGLVLNAPSLPAIKKQIDKVAPFTAFEAFTIDRNDEIRKHTVVGIRKNRGYEGYSWVTADGHSPSTVYQATPENMARAKKLTLAKEKHEKIRRQHDALESKLLDAILECTIPSNPA